MNTLARVLAVYLLLVLADAVGGFKLYHRVVHAGAGAWCRLTGRAPHEQHECASRLFYSRALWLAISAVMGVIAGYVAMQAAKTGRW
jgi:hypothetical protein